MSKFSSDLEIMGHDEFTKEELDFLRTIKSSPSKFCKSVLGTTPFPYQEKFLEDNSKRIIACAGRQVGKSLISAAKALWFSMSNQNTMTLIVSSTQRQSSLMFDKILRYVESSYLVEQSVVRQTRTLIRFSNGSEIIALPCGRYGASLRGYTAHMVIIDEAAFVPEEVITEVVMPMLSTTDGTVIMISTPYDRGHYFFKAFNSPNWSKYRFKTEDNPKVARHFLEEQREEVGELQFRQEYLAEFVDDEKTYFPMTLLRPCVHVCDSVPCNYCNITSGKTEPSGELYAGYDPGGMSDPAALVVVQRVPSSDNKKPFYNVVLTKTFLSRSSKEESDEIYTRFTVEVSDLHKKLHFKKLSVDSTGIGKPIIEHCRELGLPVEGVSFTQSVVEELLSNVKILLERKSITLRDNLDLLCGLNCITAKRNRLGAHMFDHASGTHDDLGYALALALRPPGKNPTIIMMTDKDRPKPPWQESRAGYYETR